MAEVESRCRVEEELVAALERRGWTIRGASRSGLDLDLDVEVEGQTGRIALRGVLDVPKGMRASSMTSSMTPEPRSLRIDLGDPSGEPERWAVWDHYSFPARNDTNRIVTTVHEAIGQDWASVMGSDVVDGKFVVFGFSASFDALLEHAEALSPGRDAASRRAHLRRFGRLNYGQQRKRTSPFLIIPLFVMLVVVPSIYMGGDGGGLTAILSSLLYLGGGFAAIMAFVGLIVLIQRWRIPKHPVEGMEDVAQRLRAAGAVGDVELTPLNKREGLAVVVRREGYLDADFAPLEVSRLLTKAENAALSIEADLCLLRWPSEVLDELRFLPDRWLLVEATGDDGNLARLPLGPREDRFDGGVRWLITGEELDGGRADELFEGLAAATGGASGPYR